MRLRLSVQRVSRLRPLPSVTTFKNWVRVAIPRERQGAAEITVRLVDERESAALNSRYRGKTGSTNVLSFGYDSGQKNADISGDLVICAPVVVREARAQGKPVRAHWAHMVVHGILHLQGYDHVRPSDATAMEALEVRLLNRLGFPNPYTLDP